MNRFYSYSLIAIVLFSANGLKVHAQYPGYFKLKTINGTVYNTDNTPIDVEFISRYKLKITNCTDPDVDTLLRTLTLTRVSRDYLTHLITTSAKVVINVSDNIGIAFSEGKYRFIAGICGPDEDQSHTLIPDLTSSLCPRKTFRHPVNVYAQSTITLFKGSISYVHTGVPELAEQNVQIFDLDSNRCIKTFSMDSVVVEKIMYPDMLYRNTRELYFFGGTHEVCHSTAENIAVNDSDLCEAMAFDMEKKLFKKRKAINRKKIIYPTK